MFVKTSTTPAPVPAQPGSDAARCEAANTAIGGIDRFLENPPASAIHPTSINDASLVGPVLANARGDTAAAHRLGFLEGTRDEVGTKFAAKPTASASLKPRPFEIALPRP